MATWRRCGGGKMCVARCGGGEEVVEVEVEVEEVEVEVEEEERWWREEGW